MNTKRYAMLDAMRGLTLISMIAYHTVWDMVYIFGQNWDWFESYSAYIWQQSICCSFILLSGFCWSFGQKKWKRGLLVFGAGVLISLITIVFMPENRILFGVLTLLGSCMLIMILLEYPCCELENTFELSEFKEVQLVWQNVQYVKKAFISVTE